jgi:hypothetical protein
MQSDQEAMGRHYRSTPLDDLKTPSLPCPMKLQV